MSEASRSAVDENSGRLCLELQVRPALSFWDEHVSIVERVSRRVKLHQKAFYGTIDLPTHPHLSFSRGFKQSSMTFFNATNLAP